MKHFRTLLGACAFSILAASHALADKVTITDITGRRVEVETPVQRVILGEGRQVFFTAVLETENPFARVVGWRDDLKEADPDSCHCTLINQILRLRSIFGRFYTLNYNTSTGNTLQCSMPLERFQIASARARSA